MRPYRKAVYDCLNSQVSYGGSTIPIYDEKVLVGTPPAIYILLSTQREADITDNDCAWMVRGELDIVIVTRSDSEVSKDGIDRISDLIYQLLVNSPGSHNLAAQSGFDFTNVRIASAASAAVQISPTQSELQKIITLTSTIIIQS